MTEAEQRRIANRLDQLLAGSAPIGLTDTCVPSGEVLKGRYSGSAGLVAEELSKRRAPVIAASEVMVMQQLIAEGAEAREQVNITAPEFRPHEWVRATEIPWGPTERLWRHCRPAIEQIIAIYNTERVVAYEAYRQACMQGVAIPPPG